MADDPDRPRQRAVSVEDSGMGDLLRFDAERLRILVERHLLFTGSARARAAAGRLGRRARALRQGHAEGLPPRAARTCRPSGRPPPKPTRGRMTAVACIRGIAPAWVSRPAFSRSSATTAAMKSRTARRSTWKEFVKPLPEPELARAGGALHGLRHPVLPPGLPGQQPDPGLEQPGLSRPVAGGADRRCTPPTISRNSPAASARRRARRPAR